MATALGSFLLKTYASSYVLHGITNVLVTEDVFARVIQFIREQEGVGVTHPRSGNLEKHLLGARFRDRDILQN